MALINSVKLQTAAYASFISILVLWIIHIIASMLGMELGWLGILPRHVVGLKGILFAPLIHDNFQHLFYNSMPLLVMVGMITFFYRKVAIRSISMMYVLTGLAVWLFARPVFHIGASGVVYALVSFVFFSGLFRRNVRSIILALVVTMLYSGMVTGIFPNQQGISWESHLFGAVIGLYVAYFYKNEIEHDQMGAESPWVRTKDLPEEEGQFFFDRETFEKTRAERRAEIERLREIERQQADNVRITWTSDRTDNNHTS
ncbi:MAG: rhomboid family intramembrane serine protease [Bacteroidia bacterium]|nr:rhomboid family intramembrane serine protease [Bacteroidia bacterium]